MSVVLLRAKNIFDMIMSFEVNDNMNLSCLQSEFNKLFPYLKLEFYEKDGANNKKIIQKTIYNNSRILGEFKNSSVSKPIVIIPEMTVQELSDNFNQQYSLSPKVFRRSGNVWLSTSVTDGWSLQEQNKQGELITAQMADSKL